MQEGLAEKLGSRDFAGIIKQLDAQIKQSDQNTQAQLQQLLLNRGYFLSHLGLCRKAVKVGLVDFQGLCTSEARGCGCSRQISRSGSAHVDGLL